MIDQIKDHIAKVHSFHTEAPDALEAFRIEYLGKKGILNEFFTAFKSVPNDQKKSFGQAVNELKSAAEAVWQASRTLSKDEKLLRVNMVI